MFHSRKEEDIEPFDELILSWNGERPDTQVNFFVRLKTDRWSEYILYSSWGPNVQQSYKGGVDISVYQDVIQTKTKATGFEIKVEGAPSDAFRFHVFVNQESQEKNEDSKLSSVQLNVPLLSQQVLNHPRCADLCSPTSTAAVISYLLNRRVDPVMVANGVSDLGFDIFGNWVLNVAHASSLLGSNWSCWVEKLQGFELLHGRLMRNTPVVVSVRGPLIGSALPYAKGHLLVVTGYDAGDRRVLCMDPAFPTNLETKVSYPIQDFIEAWSRRGFIAYIFENNNN